MTHPKRAIQLAYDNTDAARLNMETAFARADRRESLVEIAKQQLGKAMEALNGKCRHRNALVIIASPGPGVKAERWCPECGAHYGPIYTKKHGWKTKRAWNKPGGAAALAYVRLCEENRAYEKRRRLEEIGALRMRHFREIG